MFLSDAKNLKKNCYWFWLSANVYDFRKKIIARLLFLMRDIFLKVPRQGLWFKYHFCLRFFPISIQWMTWTRLIKMNIDFRNLFLAQSLNRKDYGHTKQDIKKFVTIEPYKIEINGL